jgi:hypothetical protein
LAPGPGDPNIGGSLLVLLLMPAAVGMVVRDGYFLVRAFRTWDQVGADGSSSEIEAPSETPMPVGERAAKFALSAASASAIFIPLIA